MGKPFMRGDMCDGKTLYSAGYMSQPPVSMDTPSPTEIVEKHIRSQMSEDQPGSAKLISLPQ
jgi:hypothetical protein